jgi:hypothetical protein
VDVIPVPVLLNSSQANVVVLAVALDTAISAARVVLPK